MDSCMPLASSREAATYTSGADFHHRHGQPVQPDLQAHADASTWKARRLCLATGRRCRWQLPASSDRSVRSDRRTGTHGSYLRRDPLAGPMAPTVHHGASGRDLSATRLERGETQHAAGAPPAAARRRRRREYRIQFITVGFELSSHRVAGAT